MLSHDLLSTHEGYSFMTYDIFEDHFINKNQKNDCSYQLSGAWWTNCDRKTNLNSFVYDEMLFQGNKTFVSKIALRLVTEEYRTTSRKFC